MQRNVRMNMLTRLIPRLMEQRNLSREAAIQHLQQTNQINVEEAQQLRD